MPSCLLPDPPAENIGFDLAGDLPFGMSSRANPEIRKKVELLVRKLAPAYGIDPRLALAIIFAESDFNPTAVSPKSAKGLMQLMPETAQRFGVRRIMDPTENINGGLAYLQWLLAFFQGNVPLTVAAYNAGERAVEKYRGIPPYAETRAYVKLVTNMYRRIEHSYDPGVVQPSSLVARLNHSRH
jgi:soluble lytic murein transglycosylase-like protein